MTELNRPCLIKTEGITLSAEEVIELIKAVHENKMPFRLRAGGFSMSPFVKNGDIVTIEPKSKTPVRMGDIVAFVHPVTRRLIIHRIIETRGTCFKVRGDGMHSDDGLIPYSSILGAVSRVERDGKNIYMGLGFEKYLIAALSGRSLLTAFINFLYRIRQSVRNGLEKVRM
jgi:signal peptidase I